MSDLVHSAQVRGLQRMGVMVETGILGVKSWRERKGISLESIAESTKLSVRHLDAIEIGDFRRLPGGHLQYQLHQAVRARDRLR